MSELPASGIDHGHLFRPRSPDDPSENQIRFSRALLDLVCQACFVSDRDLEKVFAEFMRDEYMRPLGAANTLVEALRRYRAEVRAKREGASAMSFADRIRLALGHVEPPPDAFPAGFDEAIDEFAATLSEVYGSHLLAKRTVVGAKLRHLLVWPTYMPADARVLASFRWYEGQLWVEESGTDEALQPGSFVAALQARLLKLLEGRAFRVALQEFCEMVGMGVEGHLVGKDGRKWLVDVRPSQQVTIGRAEPGQPVEVYVKVLSAPTATELGACASLRSGGYSLTLTEVTPGADSAGNARLRGVRMRAVTFGSPA